MRLVRSTGLHAIVLDKLFHLSGTKVVSELS